MIVAIITIAAIHCFNLYIGQICCNVITSEGWYHECLNKVCIQVVRHLQGAVKGVYLHPRIFDLLLARDRRNVVGYLHHELAVLVVQRLTVPCHGVVCLDYRILQTNLLRVGIPRLYLNHLVSVGSYDEQIRPIAHKPIRLQITWILLPDLIQELPT